MDYKIYFVILSSALMIIDVIPYVFDISKGKTKPRVVSWFIWTILELIAFFAAVVDHQYPTAALLLCSAFATLIVSVFGWSRGDKRITKLDIACLILAIIGIVLWLIFDSPLIATFGIIGINIISDIPTLIHAWVKPHEETLTTFIVSTIAATLTLFAIDKYDLIGVAYPLFLSITCMTLTLTIVTRRRVLKVKPKNKKKTISKKR